MTGKDPFSGQAFTKKSETQRFSNRENQIKYNNRKVTERRRTLSAYLKILNRNRETLQTVLGEKVERVVSRDFLDGTGYNIEYHTHSGLKDKVVGVFEYGLTPLTGSRYKIFRNRPVLDEETPNPTKS
ncbi:MAG: hypothetical protein WC865_01395 [Bacteroidales bacterium]